MGDIKTLVDTKIAGKKVVVFSKSYCPYCAKVKGVIQGHVPSDLNQDDIDWIEIDDRADCDSIQDYLKQLTGARSVPRVFISGISLGGCDDTMAAESSGKLRQLLRA